MKNITNILHRSSLTPKDRVKLLVQNFLILEKTGKETLTEADLVAITETWIPKNNNEVQQYNGYLKIAKLRMSLNRDTKMYALQAENGILKWQRVIDFVIHKESDENHLRNVIEKCGDNIETEALEYILRNTYIPVEEIALHNETDLHRLLNTNEIVRDGNMIPGTSLYHSKSNVDFILEYREQVTYILPFISMLICVHKNIPTAKQYATLGAFISISKRISLFFDIDIEQSLIEHRNDYSDQILLLNLSIAKLLDSIDEHIFQSGNWKYKIKMEKIDFRLEPSEKGSTDEIIDEYNKILNNANIPG